MSEWPIVKLGELLKPSPKKTAGELDAPILSITMHDGLVEQGTRFKKQIASLDTSIYRIVFKGQLVVGFPIDEGVLDFQDKYSQALVSPAYGVWDLVSDEVTPEFLGLFLKSPRAISIYKSRLRGTTARRRSLPTKVFQEIEFPLPPLGEQKRIAEILGGASKAINEIRTEIKRVESLCGAVVSLYAEDQSTKKLEDLATLSGGLSLGSHRKNKPHSVGYLRVANVFWGKILYDEIKELNCTDQEFERTLLQDGDVLITEAHANRFQVGRSAVFRGEEQALVFQNHLFRARPNKNIDSDVLAAMLSSVAVRRQLYQMTKTTSGLNTISISQVRSLRVPVLDTTKQAELLSFLQESNKLNYLLHRKLSLLQELQKSLATRAFAGLL